MKVFQFMFATVAVVFSGWMTSNAQVAEPEVPGDHFSLEGALELFKQSASPEEFEKMLNSPDSKVNNLDLNGDGYIDYVRVIDRYDRNIHAFIIQAVISERETQDIAVIELEKRSNGKAVLQIVGDEDIYGVTTIIEPTREVRTYAGTRSTPAVVNVWAWPSVQYVYSPAYTVWVSPWGWHRRPVWYRTWRPIAYVHYYPIWRPYRPYYAVCNTHRIVYAREIYRPYRRTSVVVVNRHREQLTRYRDDYRAGRTRDHARRTYVNGNGRSDSQWTTDRRKEPSNLTRGTGREDVRTTQRENARTTQRSVLRDHSGTREQAVSPEVQRSTELRRSGSSERRAEPSRQDEVLRRAKQSPTNSRTRTIDRDVQQRAPNVAPQRSESRQATRSTGSVERRESVRQQATRPTVERSSPSRQSAVQQHRSAPRERTYSAPSGGGNRQPASRPTVSQNRSSGSSVQHRAPSRQAPASRPADARRGRN